MRLIHVANEAGQAMVCNALCRRGPQGLSGHERESLRMRAVVAKAMQLARTIKPHVAANKQFSVTFSVFAKPGEGHHKTIERGMSARIG
jgi:hypothetical protein